MADTPKSPTIIRVEIEMDNGNIDRLTGEEAVKWWEGQKTMVTLAYAHGVRFDELKWEKVEAKRG
jgi:hypothetical protein